MHKQERDLLLYIANMLQETIPVILEMLTEIVLTIDDQELAIKATAKVGAMKIALDQKMGLLLKEEE